MGSEHPLDGTGRTLQDFSLECLERCKPGVLPIPVHADDRGWSLMGLFAGNLTGGQINFSVQYAGVVKAWHRHWKQTDYWCVVTGMLKVGVMSDDGRRWLTYLGEKRPAILVIPPRLWHGAAVVGNRDAGLMYHVSEVYNTAEPDEYRQPADWRWNPWAVDHH